MDLQRLATYHTIVFDTASMFPHFLKLSQAGFRYTGERYSVVCEGCGRRWRMADLTECGYLVDLRQDLFHYRTCGFVDARLRLDGDQRCLSVFGRGERNEEGSLTRENAQIFHQLSEPLHDVTTDVLGVSATEQHTTEVHSATQGSFQGPVSSILTGLSNDNGEAQCVHNDSKRQDVVHGTQFTHHQEANPRGLYGCVNNQQQLGDRVETGSVHFMTGLKQVQSDELSFKLLAVENKKLKEQLMCRVCHQEPVRDLFLPCGELYACTECSKPLTHCPSCGKLILATVTTYFS